MSDNWRWHICQPVVFWPGSIFAIPSFLVLSSPPTQSFELSSMLRLPFLIFPLSPIFFPASFFFSLQFSKKVGILIRGTLIYSRIFFCMGSFIVLKAPIKAKRLTKR